MSREKDQEVKVEIPDRIEIQDTLFLRSIAVQDAERFFKICRDNQGHFANFEFQSPAFSELQDVVVAIHSLIEYQKKSSGVSYGLWDQDQLIGLLTVNKIDWTQEIADVGLWLTEGSTGKGIALKSLQALVAVCWTVLNRLLTPPFRIPNANGY